MRKVAKIKAQILRSASTITQGMRGACDAGRHDGSPQIDSLPISQRE
jgi:hypothetical protein